MKIDYVVMGSNNDPLYLDFWPLVSKLWKEKFDITPVLGLISDNETDLIKSDYGYIKFYKEIPNINSGLLSQIVRFSLINELEGNILISDIDMIPLSKNYFINEIEKYNDDSIIIFSSDNLECNRTLQYPMCYILANRDVYKKFLDIELTWYQFSHMLKNRNENWFTDQRYLYDSINKNINDLNIHLLKRGWDSKNIANKRIDRVNWKYDEELLKTDYYIDSHLLRPYSKYKNEIDKLINIFTNG